MSASLHGKLEVSRLKLDEPARMDSPGRMTMITVAHRVLDEPARMDSPGRMTMISRVPTRVPLSAVARDGSPRMTMTRRDAS